MRARAGAGSGVGDLPDEMDEADVESELVLGARLAGAVYTHVSLRRVQARQTGRPSSHLTLRVLQLRHPVRVLRCGRLAM